MIPNKYERPQWVPLSKAAWEAEQRRLDAIALERAALRREKLRQKAKARKARKAEWTAGVAKIMAEVRRREAARAMPGEVFFSSDNPLDGERLFA